MLAHHAGGAEDADFDSRLHNCLTISLIDFDGLRVIAAWERARLACAPHGWTRGRSGTACPRRRRMPEYRWCNATTVVSIPSSEPSRTAGISRISRSSARPCTAACQSRSSVAFGIAHQPDQDLGAGFIGDDVGRAAAGRWFRYSACWGPAGDRRREAECAGCARARLAVCRWPNRPVPG